MLCTRAFEIFNRYTQLFHATTTSTLIMGEDGSAHYVFKYLRMGLEAYDRQFEK